MQPGIYPTIAGPPKKHAAVAAYNTPQASGQHHAGTLQHKTASRSPVEAFWCLRKCAMAPATLGGGGYACGRARCAKLDRLRVALRCFALQFHRIGGGSAQLRREPQLSSTVSAVGRSRAGPVYSRTCREEKPGEARVAAGAEVQHRVRVHQVVRNAAARSTVMCTVSALTPAAVSE
jgi:hypothetical protein